MAEMLGCARTHRNVVVYPSFSLLELNALHIGLKCIGGHILLTVQNLQQHLVL